MIGLIILLVIILILLIPVSALLDYKEKLDITVTYLFLKFKIGKEKTEEKPKKTSKKEDKKENKDEKKPSLKTKIKAILKEKGPIGFLNIIIELSKPVGKAIVAVVKCLYVKDLDVYYKVGGTDAAKIATDYGKTCAIIYPSLNMFCSLAHIKNPRATVDLDYDSAKSQAIASCKITIIPLQLICVLVKYLIIIVLKAVKLLK